MRGGGGGGGGFGGGGFGGLDGNMHHQPVSAPGHRLQTPAPRGSRIVERTMASRSLLVLVAALLLVLTIVVFFVVLGDYLFQPMLVQ
jgi:hypothetical protein